MLVSTCLVLTLLHLFIWFRQPQQWAHLSFSIFAFAVAVITLMEFMSMRATNVDTISVLLRWVHLPVLIFFVAIVYFVHFFFGSGRIWLAWTACGLQVFTFVLGFTTGSNQFFTEMTGLKHVAIFGGETISIPEGVLNPWYMLGPLSVLPLIAFVIDASVSTWRRGSDTDRRRAVIFSGGIVFFLLLAPGHAALVNIGLINSPYIVGLSFMPTIFAMSFELSNDVLSAAQLAYRLQESESKLRKSEQRMALAAGAAELGMWEWDIVHDEIWSTDKGRTLFGITNKQERIGFDRFLNTLYAEDREPVKQMVEKALKDSGIYDTEYRVKLPDGQLRWFAARGRIEFDGDSPLRMHGVAIDISRRKQAELEAQRQRNELAHLSRVTLLTELSGSLSHELNQPLAAILSNAQAALRFLGQDDPNLDEARDILKDIVDEDKRAGEVIHRLRLLLKKGEVQHQPLDVNDEVKEALQLLRCDLLNHNIAVNIDLAPELPAVIGDRVQIQQVLLNLLMNGCEAMSHSEITERQFRIKSAVIGRLVQVSIADQGRGITSGENERIFEPFFTTKAQGMGLGLSICRSIVTAHGGQLWAANNDDHGAGFHFTLPANFGANA
jgi:PAS domain S-box-containing protein